MKIQTYMLMHVKKEHEAKSMDVGADHEGAVDVDANGDVDTLGSVCCLLCSRGVGNTRMSKTKCCYVIFGRVRLRDALKREVCVFVREKVEQQRDRDASLRLENPPILRDRNQCRPHENRKRCISTGIRPQACVYSWRRPARLVFGSKYYVFTVFSQKRRKVNML